MAEQSIAITTLDGMLFAPIIYADAIPAAAVRDGVLHITLASHVTEPVVAPPAREHLVAVANLRLIPSSAAALRDLLDKLLLAIQPTQGGSN